MFNFIMYVLFGSILLKNKKYLKKIIGFGFNFLTKSNELHYFEKILVLATNI